MMSADGETGETTADPELIAARLVEAIGAFVEALQQITMAEGKDDPDDFERAASCIASMQKLAIDALVRHGFTPRRDEIDHEAVAISRKLPRRRREKVGPPGRTCDGGLGQSSCQNLLSA
jgi:hypothetical protein